MYRTSMPILAVLLLLFMVPASWGEKVTKGIVRFDFRGMRIGDPVPPSMRGCFSSILELGHDACLKYDEKIGHIKVSIVYSSMDDKLAGIQIMFKSKDYSGIVAAFSEKFGKPHKLEKEIVENRMGVKFMNEKAIWKTDSSDLVIEKFGSSIENGHAYIYSPEFAVELKRHNKESAKEGAKDL